MEPTPITPKLGIVETKEVLIAANEIAAFVVQRAKGGLGIDDATALVNKLLTDAEFKAVISKAVENVKAVPAEMKDIDLQEGIELAGIQLSFLPKLLGHA